MSVDTVGLTDAARTLASAIENTGIDPTQPLTRARFAQEVAMRVAPALIDNGWAHEPAAIAAADIGKSIANELRGFH